MAGSIPVTALKPKPRNLPDVAGVPVQENSESKCEISPEREPLMKVKKAVFPVAGLGTRFLPATKSSPKEMLPLIDKPLVQYVVEEAVASGIEQILFVTGRGKHNIEDHFDISVELEAHLYDRG